MGGLFIETPNSKATGAVTELDFLGKEGQIRAKAIVRHAQPEAGLGLKSATVRENDPPRRAALLRRLRSLSLKANRQVSASLRPSLLLP